MANITHYTRLETRPRDNNFTYTLAAQIRDPAVMPRIHGIGEIAAGPRMAVDAFLDRHHRIEVARRHAAIERKDIELRAHLCS